MASTKVILKELRAQFLTVSVLPVILAAALARYETGTWNPILFCLTLAGVVFLHFGTNTANDYYDHISGTDKANTEYVSPFTGGSRLIQNGAIAPRTVLIMSISFFAAASAAGALIYISAGPVVIFLGIFGIFLGFFYTAPPVRLAGRGLGEIAVLTGFWLMSIGTYFVQTGSINLHSIIGTLPLALLTTAIIVINEFQDIKSDELTGKRTLVVRLGRKRSVWLFAGIILSAFIPVIAGILAAGVPLLALVGLLPVPLALKAISTAREHYDSPEKLIPGNGSTILCHLATGILLTAAYIISG